MTFKEFLVKDGAVTIRHRNIQNVEMFKAKNNPSPKMMKEIFPDRNYSGPHLRSQVNFEFIYRGRLSYHSLINHHKSFGVNNILPHKL